MPDDLYLYSWLAHQGRQINRIQGEVYKASDRSHDAEGLNYRTILALEAIWSLMKERDPTLTDEILKQRIAEIDAADGKVDGKISVGTVNCSSCGRVMNTKMKRCLYCGSEDFPGSPIAR